jgi:glutaconate CoA-transferase subunit A
MSSAPLFADPSPDAARRAFAGKDRGLSDKVTSVSDAVARLVRDGDYLACGGFSTNRIPVAVLHEILRQKKQNLSVAGYTTTHVFQLLAAGNRSGHGKLVAKLDLAYAVGLEARGLSPHSRRVLQSGDVETVEWSNYTLALRFAAAAVGVPFLPVRSLLGTDTFARSAAKEIVCPFTGITLAAVPALYPDVAALHVHEADRFGNGRFIGTSAADLDIVRSAKTVILTCERLVPTDDFRREPHRTQIPFFCVDAVCEVPYGSYPAGMPGEYASDERHLKAWLEVEQDEAVFNRFLGEHVFGVKDFAGYLEMCGGAKRLEELRFAEAKLCAE